MHIWHQIYLRKIESRHKNAVHLNAKLLRHAVECYFLDLERLKAFHDIQFADQHKRAAFTMLWLARIKPVQLATDVNMTKALMLVNEAYAIHAGLAHMAIDIDTISTACLRNLLYTLHYRNSSPEVLSFLAYLMECACKKINP